MSDEIEVVAYNRQWPAFFIKEKAQLLSLLPGSEILEINHIGSTAIPSLSSKPIIDILIVVKSLEKAKETFPFLLKTLNYIYWHDNPEKDRMFFVKGMPPHGRKRTHHIHVFEEGHQEILRKVNFVKLLSANASIRQSYELLKYELAKQYPSNREAYTEAKSLFIQKYLAL